MSLTDWGSGWAFTILILFSSILMLWAETTKPKNYTSSLWNWYFFKLTKRPCFWRSSISYNFHVWLARVLSIDQNIIQIHHNKDIKLFNKDFIDIALKTGWYVGKAKRHNLILEVAISGVKNRLPLIVFLISHLIISICKIQLSKLLGLV